MSVNPEFRNAFLRQTPVHCGVSVPKGWLTPKRKHDLRQLQDRFLATVRKMKKLEKAAKKEGGAK